MALQNCAFVCSMFSASRFFFAEAHHHPMIKSHLFQLPWADQTHGLCEIGQLLQYGDRSTGICRLCNTDWVMLFPCRQRRPLQPRWSRMRLGPASGRVVQVSIITDVPASR